MPNLLNDKVGKIFSGLVMALLGFIVVAGLIHSLLPNPLNLYAEYRTEKLALLSHDRANISSASFGSSHVHNGFDPREFDRTLGFNPLNEGSVNLGVAGGSQTEQLVMAKQFLRSVPESRSSKTCLVLLELNAGANFQQTHFFHPRTINIYDFDTTRFALQLVDKHLGLLRSLGRVGFPVSAMMMHYANVGMLSSAVFQPQKIDKDLLLQQTAEHRRGLLLVPFNAKESQEVYAFAQSASQSKHKTHAENLVAGNSSLISELQQVKANCSPQFFYFVTPKVSDLLDVPEYPATISLAQQAIPIFNFARPDVYPQLYNPVLWHDQAHLNVQGAKVFTHLIALEVKRWYFTHDKQLNSQD